jgi:histone deacetylase 6
MKAENSRTGKGVSQRMIKQFEQAEAKKDEDLEKVRLRNISLRTTLRKMEKLLRSKEQLAEGLHMIDFEQLKIENQTLNEKIEERNEELGKLKRKKTFTVQVLTHIREKTRFVEKTNGSLREKLATLEREIIDLTSQSGMLKQERDDLKFTNLDLKGQRGFATSDLLIVDYEQRKTLMDNLKASLHHLQERHAALTSMIQKDAMTLAASIPQTSTVPKNRKPF